MKYKVAFAVSFLLVATLAIAWLTNQRLMSKYGPQIPFNSQVWDSADLTSLGLSPRQKMLRDLTVNVLPGKTKDEIEQLLGVSPIRGEWGRSGSDYYLKHLEWDLVYPLGRDQTSDESSPDTDYLTIKLDAAGRFTSWYINGDQIWPKVAGKKASATYRKITAKGESSLELFVFCSSRGKGVLPKSSDSAYGVPALAGEVFAWQTGVFSWGGIHQIHSARTRILLGNTPVTRL